MGRGDSNRPVRLFFKATQGGLGAGNLGVIMARHGTGKRGVLVSLLVDHALEGHKSLHVAVGESAGDIRAFQDEVFKGLVASLGLGNLAELRTQVERHRQIYCFRDGAFTVERLREALRILEEHAGFVPEVIELTGWPDFALQPEADLEPLKRLAAERGCRFWVSVHTHATDPVDGRGVPPYLARQEHLIAVLIGLEPEGDQVGLRFLKTHDRAGEPGVSLVFDLHSQLLRWR